MVVHPQVATTAHLASCAAAKQGKYPQFKNELWTKGFDPYSAARDPSKLGEDNVIAIAKDIGLNIDKLKTDMKSDECKTLLQADMQELAKFHVNSTPTLFVNGTHVGGALPEQQLQDDDRREAQARRAIGRRGGRVLREGSDGEGREAVPLEEGSEADLIGGRCFAGHAGLASTAAAEPLCPARSP